MNGRIKTGFSLAVLAVLAGSAMRVPADTITTSDGQSYTGRIEKTATGYSIHTASGVVTVADSDVKQVMFDHVPAAAPGRPRTADPKTVRTLQDQGRAAYAAGAFDASRDLFTDALRVEPANAASSRGLGMALVRLSHPSQAVDPLERACKNLPADRELVIVLSTALVESKNPMRAVKFVKDFMEKTPANVDEDCLNALGGALAQASDVAKKQTLFKDATDFYLKCNKKLEAKRPGERRWGATWMAAEDVDKFEKVIKTAQQQTVAATKKIPALQNRIDADQRDMVTYSGTMGDNNRTKAYDAAKADRDAAQKELDGLQKDIETAGTSVADCAPQIFPLLETLDAEATETANAAAHSATDVAGGDATKPDKPDVDKTDADKTATDKTTTDKTDADKADTDKTDADKTGPGHAAPVGGNKPPTKPAAKPDTNVATDDTTPKPAGPIARAIVPNAPDAEPSGPITKYGAAFAVAPDLIVAPASVVAGSRSIHVDVAVGPSFDATVIRADAADGLVLIRVAGANFTPYKFADRAPDKQTTSLGYPSVDIFNPIAETMVVTKSPSNAADHAKFSIPPRIPGAPLLQNAAVVGMELAGRSTDPAEVPVVPVDVLKKFVGTDAAAGGTGGKDSVVQLVSLR